MADRFPIYLVLDVSGSMGAEGDPTKIQAVKSGLNSVKGTLLSHPATQDVAYISIITFGNGIATQVVPLTHIEDFEPPKLIAGGNTPLAQALLEVTKCADCEKEDGDAYPLVFIMTDGEPTDKPHYLSTAIEQFIKYPWIGVGAFAAGFDANMDVLKQLVVNNGENTKELREVIVLDTADHADYTKFFNVVTAVVIDSAEDIGYRKGSASIAT